MQKVALPGDQSKKNYNYRQLYHVTTDMGRVTILTEQGLQLQIQTIQFTPAVVSFNYDQIAAVLADQLVKYQGLTFTEDSEAEAKKVIAELRKGKALLETYRKEKKAELTAPVTAFEQQIKELAGKFDTVIGPLTEQTDRFETDRRSDKCTLIEGIIGSLVTEHDLQLKFASQMVIEEVYLNRSTTMKAINTLLREKAIQLKADQDRKESELKLIKGTVYFINETFEGAGLLESTYIRLHGTLPLEDVLQRITEDAMAMKIREQQAAERRLNEQILAERKAVEAQVAQANREAAVKPLDPIASFSNHMAEEEPVGIFEAHNIPEVGVTFINYSILGTPEEHQELKDFMTDRLYEWSSSI